jgi:hypothetical protein
LVVLIITSIPSHVYVLAVRSSGPSHLQAGASALHELLHPAAVVDQEGTYFHMHDHVDVLEENEVF